MNRHPVLEVLLASDRMIEKIDEALNILKPNTYDIGDNETNRLYPQTSSTTQRDKVLGQSKND
jgi:hypothetical protein